MKSEYTPLQGKNILLAISGGIAAYKCAELTRRLIDQGASVRIVMTSSAKAFITPLTMQAVSGHHVSDDLLNADAERGMGHIELAKWADLVLIAPATANIIAKITTGIADDLLSTLCVAASSPIAISPAMNVQMYKAPATQANLKTLTKRGLLIWGPGEGEQACGDMGKGRMLDPNQLVSYAIDFFTEKNKPLKNLQITITAGPTQEAIDPVRYISNHSSGKMGFSLADEAQKMGATVTLISGPVHLDTPKNITRIDVLSAQDMHQASLKNTLNADIFIACAAVADYRPEVVASQKMKKQENIEDLMIKLVKNPDIIADVAALDARPFCVGFAAETQNVEAYALKKLNAKNLDLIAANDVSKVGQGFNSDQNALTVFSAKTKTMIPLASKSAVAEQLLLLISEKFNESKTDMEIK
jgi:phosphopantothenoylcysteine decarboxylase/phosphopantothenate--cysteine ligase